MIRTVDFSFPVYRNGVQQTELLAINAPILNMSSDGDIHTSLTGTFAYDASFNLLTDDIRPQVIINGVKYQLGVFYPATVTESDDSSGRNYSITAYDKGWILQSSLTESTLYFPKNSNYITAIVNLLNSCGINSLNITQNSAVLQTAREDWPIGTSYLRIINNLLDEINYNPIWFNSLGQAVVEPETVPNSGNIKHYLDASNVESLILPSKTNTLDIYSRANVFIVICSNPEFSSMRAVSENNFYASPLSIQRRGRRIVSVTKVDNIPSKTELQKYADLLMQQSMNVVETIKVSTAIFPDWGVNDTVAFNYNETRGLCTSAGYSMSLEPGGKMSHTLRKVGFFNG